MSISESCAEIYGGGQGRDLGPGPVQLGSDRHKVLFSRMLLDTFNPYKPAVIDWPPLDNDERDRLVSLPFWDIAVQTEGRASINVMSFAREITDPLLRQAIELNGFEENRHKTVLSHLVHAYGIALAPEPPYPAPSDPEWAFMRTGYNASTVFSRSDFSSWRAVPVISGRSWSRPSSR